MEEILRRTDMKSSTNSLFLIKHTNIGLDISGNKTFEEKKVIVYTITAVDERDYYDEAHTVEILFTTLETEAKDTYNKLVTLLC